MATMKAAALDKAQREQQDRASRLANQVVDRHLNLLKRGNADGEAFRKDFKRDVLQAICQVAGVPVPDVKV
jgi:hypothetical protein